MNIRHSWEYWKDVTRVLERSGKLDALDDMLETVTTKEDLYNELLALANTIEELVVLAYSAGLWQAGYLMARAERYELPGGWLMETGA